MKKIVLMVVFIVTVSFLNAQIKSNNEEALVNQTIIDYEGKLANLDTSALKQYSTKDVLLLADGSVWNMDSLINAAHKFKGVAFKRINHITFIKTEVKGDIAWVAYSNVADITIDGQEIKVQWLNSVLLLKEGKEWKIKLDHSTKLKPGTE